MLTRRRYLDDVPPDEQARILVMIAEQLHWKGTVHTERREWGRGRTRILVGGITVGWISHDDQLRRWLGWTPDNRFVATNARTRSVAIRAVLAAALR